MPVKRPAAGELEPIETASRDELAALQLERLRWSLAHAYEHVPHYRRKFDAAACTPGISRRSPTSRKFPFTTKADLRDNYPFGMFAVPREQVVRIHASSGTTGKPTVVGYTRRTSTRGPRDGALDPRRGGRAGDIIHVAYGYGLFTGGLGAHYGAEKLGCTVIPMSGGMTERQVQLIHDFKPDIIMVTPSYMLAIAEEMERQGIDPRDSSLRSASSAPSRGRRDARAIEAKLEIDAIDIYGSPRSSVPASRRSASRPRTGSRSGRTTSIPRSSIPNRQRAADGEKGELVFTSLTKEALPMIRYRTRDLTRCCRRRRGRCAGWRRSPAAPTTC
jgi:phenylacetate-CoA ligase